MITKTIRTLSGPVKIKIPENLYDINLGQMIAMENIQEGDQSIPLIPDLTNEVVGNIVDIQDLLNIRERILSLAHQIKYCYKETKIPEYIVFGTKKVRHFGIYFERDNKVKVIKNLSIEPAGAYMVCRDLIADEINRHINLYGEDDWRENFVPSLDVCAGMLAHYFYCRVTGELYNEQKAEAFKEVILKLPVQTALPVARYFFLTYPNLSQLKIPLWQVFKQILKKKRALRRLKSLNI